MKINIANPTTGLQKTIEVDDDKKLRHFYDRRMAAEIEGDVLGDEYKGYVFKISGGNDKDGFPMKQGILANHRVRIVLTKTSGCYAPKRSGERKRKSVRGCIVGPDLAVLDLVLVKKGIAELPGLTDSIAPRRLGPKRANHIRKLFNLSKEDDVRKYVIRRTIQNKKRQYTKAPRIQRLVTSKTLQRKRRRLALKRKRLVKNKQESRAYKRLIEQRLQAKKTQRERVVAAKRRQTEKLHHKKVAAKLAKKRAEKNAKPVNAAKLATKLRVKQKKQRERTISHARKLNALKSKALAAEKAKARAALKKVTASSAKTSTKDLAQAAAKIAVASKKKKVPAAAISKSK